MTGRIKKTVLNMTFILISPSLFYGFIGILDFSGKAGFSYDPGISILYASEENDSAEIDEVSGKSDVEESGIFNFSADGFTEIENYYSADNDKTNKERNLKNEIRVNLELKAGTESFYLYSRTNFYYNPQFADKKTGEKYNYKNDLEISDSLMVSDENYEIEPYELYLNFSNSLLRVRAGNQVYLWGTADVYNPTSYFNPLDLREYVFADDDELKLAVPSGSMMLFLGPATVEMVFVPVHIPAELPADGNYWQIRPETAQITVDMLENKGLDKDISNAAYGIRSAFSPGGVDISLSYYHGPDRNPVFVPVNADPLSPFSAFVEIQPEYFVLNMFGFDISTQISDFVVQCEAVYSPDKTWLVETDINEFILENMTGSSPFETEESPFFHYAVGFNYYIPVNRFFEDYDGESIITVEWQHPVYADEDLMDPLLTKILLIRFEEICFDNRLKASISYIAEIDKNVQVITPEIKFDFENGFSLKGSYVYIDAESDSDSFLPGEDTSVIYFVRDKDMFTFSVRYDF
jgi:hypothetical protein